MSEARASLIVRIMESAASNLVSLLIGAALFLPGLYWFYTEVSDKTPGATIHMGHMGVAVGMMVLGALVVRPDQITGGITKVFVVVFPNGLPLLGGRRSSDPQPPADK